MELKKQLSLLVQHQKWEHVRAWFSYCNNEEELAEKVLLWGKLFLPTYFRFPSPVFHKDLIKKFFSKQNEYTAAPRGFAKTSITQTCIMYSVCYGLDKFIVLIEKNFTEASEVLSAIRDEFENNPRIQQVYGQLIKHDAKGVEQDKSKDTQGDLFINGVRLRGKGFNAPVRGLKSKEWRPTRIIVDDVEEDTHINSDEQRMKYKTNFTQGIIPALDIEGSIKMVGTILHFDSLLMNLINQHKGKIYKAYDVRDPAHTLLWPERWPLERLDERKKEMMLEGLGSSKFSQEYLNEPVDDETRPFKWEWLMKEYTELPKNLAVYSTIDVAQSIHEGSDYTGVITVGIDEHNNWYILRVERRKVNITGLIDLIFKVWKEDSPIQIGIEKLAFEDQVKPLMDVISEKIKEYPAVVELKHGGRRKEDRIKGALQGRFEHGNIYFKANATDDTKLLRSELYDFPSAVFDDLADALAYISQFAYQAYSPTDNSLPAKSVYNDDYYWRLATQGVPDSAPVEFQDWQDLG